MVITSNFIVYFLQLKNYIYNIKDQQYLSNSSVNSTMFLQDIHKKLKVHNFRTDL